MNVLFLSISSFESINTHGIYPDLLREFIKNGHKVYILSPAEKIMSSSNLIIYESGSQMVKVKTGKIQQTNIVEKGINTILVEYHYIEAIKKYYCDVKFELILYPTPPITLPNVIEYVKKRDNARAYLMLKDIFPQNAIDIGMMSKSGITGMFYRYFRGKEKKLYAISDRIGCMSQANVEYIIAHNLEIPAGKVGLCPNSIEVRDLSIDEQERIQIREKYGLPLDKKIFVYGGNLGKPQGIPFLIDCLKTQLENSKVFFLIVGGGTEYVKLKMFFNEIAPENMRLMHSVPKEDYDRMIAACDVGMVFLDYRFTIPNFPSRLLSYMQAKLPVLACTDLNTDIGKVIIDGGFGWWSESVDARTFNNLMENIITADLKVLGQNGFEYLNHNYSVHNTYKMIIDQILSD